MSKTGLSPHNGIFYDTREFIGAVFYGQIDRMTLDRMSELQEPHIDCPSLGRPSVSECSDVEIAACIANAANSDSSLRDLFDSAVEKIEDAKKHPPEPTFRILMKYTNRKGLLYLTKDGELDYEEGHEFTQEDLQRVWPTLILENLERIDILR